jgi:transposase
MFEGLLTEIQQLDERVVALEVQLQELARQSPQCQRLQSVPGVGLIVSTAFVGTVGDIKGFRSARRFASWLGLTPREHSSGGIRRLGAISKRGDSYLRMLLVQGARSVLYSADASIRAGRPLGPLGHFGVRVRSRSGHNKAAVAVSNKLARIVWATWRNGTKFEVRPPAMAAA